jgi:alkanesulfonate monooxygenase SsuD/methylene tetrahydromethanopterin reductase-like flavin-dependent oxidoreductase (luciferase family)
VAERFDRLEEQLEIIDGLWTAEGPYSFAGKHYRIVDSPALPKPVQSPRPPIIIGGRGKKRTPALAARFADEFNTPFAPLAETAELFDRVRAASAVAGRATPPALSAAVVLCCGRDDAEVRRRATAIGRDVDEMRASGGAVGTPDQVADILSGYGEAGATRIFLQTLDLADLHHIELVASAVAPQLT